MSEIFDVDRLGEVVEFVVFAGSGDRCRGGVRPHHYRSSHVTLPAAAADAVVAERARNGWAEIWGRTAAGFELVAAAGEATSPTGAHRRTVHEACLDCDALSGVHHAGGSHCAACDDDWPHGGVPGPEVCAHCALVFPCPSFTAWERLRAAMGA